MPYSNISFFIPAYNCESTIIDSLKSVVENINKKDEIIIVDDCSSDETLSLIKAFIRENHQHSIKIIEHLWNKGGAAARNTAIEHSTHELLFCLDSDNILSPGSIQALKEYLIENKADAASFEKQHFFSNKQANIHYTWFLPTGEFPKESFLNGDNNPGQHGNYLFTKESWRRAKGYAEGVGALDTLTFGLRQCITGSKFVVLKDSFYYHRLSDSSYYINDAYKKIWSVSLKMTYALIPFFEYISEEFIEYIFKNRYEWFYNLNKRPITLVDPKEKEAYYNSLQNKFIRKKHPPLSLIKRIGNKGKRIFRIK